MRPLFFPSLLAGAVLAGCGSQQDDQPNSTASLVTASVEPASTVQVSAVTSRRFPMHRAAYTVTHADGVVTVTEVGSGVAVAVAPDTGRLQFADGLLALDIDGTGGAVYRLYQAAFDRKPDAGGYAFWLGAADAGSTIDTIAARFTGSDEFRTLYGAAPSNRELLTRMYQHVLHRTPDQAGFDFWLNALDNKIVTPAGLLAQFSDSTENKTQVLPAIQSGIWMPATPVPPSAAIDSLFAVKGKVVAVEIPPPVEMNYFCGNSGGICRASLFCRPDRDVGTTLDASVRFTLDADKGIASIYFPDKTVVGTFNAQSGAINADISYDDGETPIGSNGHKFFGSGSARVVATIDASRRQLAGTMVTKRVTGWTLSSALAMCSATTEFTAQETIQLD